MRTILYLSLAGAGLAAAAGAAQAQWVPPGHLPSPGECRVWYPHLPAGQQSPPMSCAAAERQAARYGGRVIYGGRGGPLWDDARDERRFQRWALRNFDYNRNGRLSRREYRDALNAWERR